VAAQDNFISKGEKTMERITSRERNFSPHIGSLIVGLMIFMLAVGAVCIKNNYGLKDVTAWLPWSKTPSATAEKERAEIIKRVAALEEQHQTLKAEKELYEAKLALLQKEYSRLGTKVSRMDKIQIAQYQVLFKQINFLNRNIKSLDVTLTSWRNASKGSDIRVAEYTTASRPRTTEETPKEITIPTGDLSEGDHSSPQEQAPNFAR
jgi:septal ring factor EnvC (AmiA/AmiB activator)